MKKVFLLIILVLMLSAPIFASDAVPYLVADMFGDFVSDMFDFMFFPHMGSRLGFDVFCGSSLLGTTRWGFGAYNYSVWPSGEPNEYGRIENPELYAGLGVRAEIGFVSLEKEENLIDLLINAGLAINLPVSKKETMVLNFLVGPSFYFLSGDEGTINEKVTVGVGADISISFLLGGFFGLNIGAQINENIHDFISGSVSHIPTGEGHFGLLMAW